jgi:hypothetical protein
VTVPLTLETDSKQIDRANEGEMTQTVSKMHLQVKKRDIIKTNRMINGGKESHDHRREQTQQPKEIKKTHI